MKRLLLLIPLLVVVTGCGATVENHAGDAPSGALAPILSRSMRLDDVPLRLDVTGFHRRGAIAALDLRLVNRAPRGGDSFDIDDTFSREGSYDLGGILLIDPRTGHELDPLDDDVDLAFTEVDGGATQSLRVAFPAPSGATADVLVPHFGLFRAVGVH